MRYNSVKRIGKSEYVNMGPIKLRQPVPTKDIDMIDPFILLHHYGPYYVDEENKASSFQNQTNKYQKNKEFLEYFTLNGH